jgi:hypothetical protein
LYSEFIYFLVPLLLREGVLASRSPDAFLEELLQDLHPARVVPQGRTHAVLQACGEMVAYLDESSSDEGRHSIFVLQLPVDIPHKVNIVVTKKAEYC